jgi:hypothetical protein
MVVFYVVRCKVCHSGIEDFAERAQFAKPAKQVHDDEETLLALDNGSSAHRGLRGCVENFRKKYFITVGRASLKAKPFYTLRRPVATGWPRP